MKPLLLVGLMLALVGTLRGDEIDPAVQKVINKGLEYVAKTQLDDGHWEGTNEQYPTTMTALAGMALLMEGSTLREGKYADNIRRAVDWLMERSQRNGLIGNPNNPPRRSRYMYGHGFGLLFLACVYGEEEDGDRRKKLEDDPDPRPSSSPARRQTSRGGWGYVSAADGGDFDEGSVTITQLQALRAARNAGIVVPKEIIDKARKYLKNCTTAARRRHLQPGHGGGGGGERPAADRRGHRLRLQRRRVQLAARQEVDRVLPERTCPARRRRRHPHRPRRVHRTTTTPRPCTSSATTATPSSSPRRQGRRAADLERSTRTAMFEHMMRNAERATAAGPAATSARSSRPRCT